MLGTVRADQNQSVNTTTATSRVRRNEMSACNEPRCARGVHGSAAGRFGGEGRRDGACEGPKTQAQNGRARRKQWRTPCSCEARLCCAGSLLL
eukprot:5317509-Pleurochrysis_carterae.AAC.1